MQLLNPGLSEDQAKNKFHRNVKKKHKLGINYASEDKVVKQRAYLVPLLIDAINMFKKVETTKRDFEKEQIKSIIILVFSATVDKSSNKGQ